MRADKKLFLQYYQASLGGAYLFQFNDRYSIGAETGVSMLYHYKNIAYSVGYPETRREVKWPWRDESRFYGVFLAMDHNYRLYRSRKYSLHLTGSLRATQVFDYLDFDPNINRVLPEFNLGVAVAFGNSRGRR